MCRARHLNFLKKVSKKGVRDNFPRVKKGIRDLFRVVGEQRLRVTTSIGIAQGIVFRNDPEEILRVADAALYEAKDAGRNTWRIRNLS